MTEGLELPLPDSVSTVKGGSLLGGGGGDPMGTTLAWIHKRPVGRLRFQG